MEREKDQEECYRRIIDLVYHKTGIDLRYYNEEFIQRRIWVRMEALGETTLEQYTSHLARSKSEAQKLLTAIGVNVSEFFRDPEVFDAIRYQLIPAILMRKERKRDKRIKVWSVGCAFGEEPYSLAMLFLEHLGSDIDKYDIQVLATDIDQEALVACGLGEYSPDKVLNVPPTLLFKYFVYDRKRKIYKVKPELKRLLRIDYHNIINDPVFLGIDLLLCRNVVIYFRRDIQTQIYRKFHLALQNGGYLVTGKAETMPPEAMKLYRVVDRDNKIYQKG